MYYKECVRLQQEIAAGTEQQRHARSIAADLTTAREALELMRARERDRAEGEALDALSRHAMLDQIENAATALRREVASVARFVGLPHDHDDEGGHWHQGGCQTIELMLAEARNEAEFSAERVAAVRLRAEGEAELLELRAMLDSREAGREELEARARMLESQLDKPLLAAWRAPGLDADAAAARKRRAEQRRQAAAVTFIAARFIGLRARKFSDKERAQRNEAAFSLQRNRESLLAAYKQDKPSRRAGSPNTKAQIQARKKEVAALEQKTGAKVPAGVPGKAGSAAGQSKDKLPAADQSDAKLSAKDRKRQLTAEVQALEGKTGAKVLNPRPTSLSRSGSATLTASRGASTSLQ